MSIEKSILAQDIPPDLTDGMLLPFERLLAKASTDILKASPHAKQVEIFNSRIKILDKALARLPVSDTSKTSIRPMLIAGESERLNDVIKRNETYYLPKIYLRNISLLALRAKQNLYIDFSIFYNPYSDLNRLESRVNLLKAALEFEACGNSCDGNGYHHPNGACAK